MNAFTAQNKIGKASLLAAILGLSCGLVAGCSSSSQEGSDDSETITLKMSGIYPEGHNLATDAALYFVDLVESKSNGKVKIDFYPAQQLGDPAEQMSLLKQGVADIATTSPGYLPSQMPLSGVFSMPRAFPTGEIGTLAYASILSETSSEIYKTDYAKNALVPLIVNVSGDYEVMTAKSPIDGVQDFKGLSTRSAGGTIDLIVNALGGTPIPIPSGEIYPALDRGSVDANLQGVAGAMGNSLDEIVKYITTNADLTAFTSAWTMSESRFESLPEDVQKLLVEAGEAATVNAAKKSNGVSDEAFKAFEASGAKLVELSESDLSSLDADLAPVRDKWVETVTGDGVDGAAALDEMDAAVDEIS